MIRLIQGSVPRNADLYAMFRGRAQVFVDRLRWPLMVGKDGCELDQFDALNPLYLLAIDRTGGIAGSMRLLPTTGPTLLTDVFAGAFDDSVDIRSASVWEVTRFCIHPGARETTATHINRATAELCIGLAEIGLTTGLSHFVGIYDDRMTKVYERIGWRPERLASSKSIHAETVHVGLWEVDNNALMTMRARSGLISSVLERNSLPVAA